MSDPRPHLLFIDDELVPGQTEPKDGDYLWYYAQALRDAGYQLTEAETTDDAFAELAVTPCQFDLIIVDVMMPPGKVLADADTSQGTRTGLVLARRIHRMFPGVPLIALTNHKWDGLRQSCQEIDGELLFKLETRPSDLVAVVGRLLSGHDRAGIRS